MGKSSFRRLGPVVVTALTLTVGCETVYDPPRYGDVSDPPWAKDETPGIERWECGDYFDGCGLFSGDCVTLTANVHEGTGKVAFGEFVERTEFRIDGIQRRWDWCLADDYSYDCAFVISVDGRGRYYSFRGTDERVTPSDIFKCTKG